MQFGHFFVDLKTYRHTHTHGRAENDDPPATCPGLSSVRFFHGKPVPKPPLPVPWTSLACVRASRTLQILPRKAQAPAYRQAPRLRPRLDCSANCFVRRRHSPQVSARVRSVRPVVPAVDVGVLAEDDAWDRMQQCVAMAKLVTRVVVEELGPMRSRSWRSRATSVVCVADAYSDALIKRHVAADRWSDRGVRRRGRWRDVRREFGTSSRSRRTPATSPGTRREVHRQQGRRRRRAGAHGRHGALIESLLCGRHVLGVKRDVRDSSGPMAKKSCATRTKRMRVSILQCRCWTLACLASRMRFFSTSVSACSAPRRRESTRRSFARRGTVTCAIDPRERRRGDGPLCRCTRRSSPPSSPSSSVPERARIFPPVDVRDLLDPPARSPCTRTTTSSAATRATRRRPLVHAAPGPTSATRRGRGPHARTRWRPPAQLSRASATACSRRTRRSCARTVPSSRRSTRATTVRRYATWRSSSPTCSRSTSRRGRTVVAVDVAFSALDLWSARCVAMTPDRSSRRASVWWSTCTRNS